MNYLNSQLAGKYKNVPFLVRNESLKGGHNRVPHKYPKTETQYMESMGVVPFSATVSIFFSGVNYKEDSLKFRQAISDPSPGRLYLPSYGVYDSIIALPTDFLSDQTNLGEISASVTFETSIERPSPIESELTEQDVSEQSESARRELQSQFAKAFLEAIYINNLSVALSDAVALAEEAIKITGLLQDGREFLRKVDTQIRNATSYASLLLNSGVPQGFLEIIGLSFPGKIGIDIFKKLASVGTILSNSMNDIKARINPKISTVVPQTPESSEVSFNINLWDDNTVERKNRNQSRLTVVNTFRLVGLIGMLESAAQATYTTTQEIDNVKEAYELYYEELIENDTSGVIIPKMKLLIDRLKSFTDVVVAQKRQNAFSVIEVFFNQVISITQIAYVLYGEYIQNEEQLDYLAGLIKGLNQSQVADRLQGTIKVVELG